MTTLIYTVIWVVFGFLCSNQAKKRGRSSVAWFYIGLFFGILGLGVLYLLPSLIAPSIASPKQSTPPQPVASPSPQIPHVLWYYLDAEDKQFGPMSLSTLQNALKEGKISAQHYVWNEKMQGWKPYEEAVKIS